LTGEVQTFEYQLDAGSGRRDFEARFAVSELGEILAIVRDITERKETERALEAQRAFLRHVLDSTPNLIFVKDRAGRYTLVNQAMAERHDTTIDAMIGKTDYEINPNKAEVERYRATDRRVLAAQKPVFITEEQLIYPGTGETHWFQTIKTPLRGPDGSVTQLLGVATDITARKEVEQRALELALEKERSQLLGDFILATTHEFGNPLSVMKTSLYMLDRIAGQDDQQRLIQMIGKQVSGIERLVEGLLTMSRLDRGEAFLFQRLNLDEVLGDVRDYTRPKARDKQQQLVFDLALDLPALRADRVQLFRALTNLVENAIAYTHDGGGVTVRSGQHGDWAVVEVHDTGMGIAQVELERVFARFYRVDEARTERGAGLGLPIARKIIDRHGGRIEVESVPGQGSIFRVFLPINGD
jgi:PAS domain S-box-containing protein